MFNKSVASGLLFTALLTSSVTFASSELRSCSTLIPQRIWKASADVNPCATSAANIVALTQTGLIYLCENGSTLKSFDIAIGRGGVGKAHEGDLKTPLGTYSLGSPRASGRFGLFIPVGYPTAVQRAQGLTGDDVGIHGPNRPFACVGALNVAFNWTQGCLAVSNDAFIAEIAQFIKRQSGTAKIEIR